MREDITLVEGHLLTMACRVRGPPGLRFTWKKDGARIRTVHTTRNMWESPVPREDDDVYGSILNIDKAREFDQGACWS